MCPLKAPPLQPDETHHIIFGVLDDDAKRRFEQEHELDTSVSVEGIGRFRLNVLEQKDGIAAVLRVIATEIPGPKDLHLEEKIVKLTDTPRGLILVTGPTRSGKSTTPAGMINIINQNRRKHILTLEDPIEYVYPKLNCVITQREIGTHSPSFASALKRAMRQDPDIVLVGEMRDLETIGAALTLAETGHLVFATLHTTDAAQTVDRIIDVFPPFQQQQVRTQLAVSLRAVICRQLLPRADGRGRVAAREIMILTPAVAGLIRDGKTHQIYGALEMGMQAGMKSLDRDLARLVNHGVVTREAALSRANNNKTLEQLIRRGMHDRETGGWCEGLPAVVPRQ